MSFLKNRGCGVLSGRRLSHEALDPQGLTDQAKQLDFQMPGKPIR